MRSVDVLESLELLGSSQGGVVTAAQASEAGVSKMHLSRLADRGTVQRVRHGVYALPSADTGPLQGLRAAWLATGSRPAGNQPLAVASGESAAAVHGLGDLLPSKYEFTTAVRRQTTQPDTRYRRRDLPDEDVTWVNGLPVTTVARTIKDLATGGTDFDHLAVAVRDAVTSTNAASVALIQALEPAAERFGFPDGEALFLALLKATGYQPDPELARLESPAGRDEFIRALMPQLENLITQLVAEQLRQLAPEVDLSPEIDRRIRAAIPDAEAISRAVAQLPPGRFPELRRPSAQKHESRDAVRRQNRKADDGEFADSAGSEPPAPIAGGQTGQRGQKPRHRG
jgi:predicted transcriptional regulator of viral defense system